MSILKVENYLTKEERELDWIYKEGFVKGNKK